MIASDVRFVLQDLDIAVRTSEDLPSGIDLGAALVEAVLSADFVCVVLSTRKPPLAVMYEAGVAVGSHRPLVVIADSKVADSLPRQLISAPLIRYKPGSKDVLYQNLRAYVQQVLPIAAKSPLNWRPQLSDVTDFIRPHPTFDENRLEGRVATRFAQAGALVTSEAQLSDNFRADIVVTFPMLGSEFNPIIVETKSSATTRAGSDIRQIRDYLQAARARLGIIVYDHGKSRPAVHIYGAQGVLRLSLNDLLSWDDERLLQEITRLRNRVVHSI